MYKLAAVENKRYLAIGTDSELAVPRSCTPQSQCQPTHPALWRLFQESGHLVTARPATVHCFLLLPQHYFARPG